MTKSKEKVKWNEMSEEDQKKVKDLFMEYEALTDIAEQFNLPRTTLSYHANDKKDSWKVERELNRAKLLSQFSSAKKPQFVKMQNSIMKVMTRAITHLAEREAPPTTREAKDVTAMLESIDKITRLDDGNPTEISGEKVMTFKDITAITDMVPFNKNDDNIIYIKEHQDEEEEDVEN